MADIIGLAVVGIFLILTISGIRVVLDWREDLVKMEKGGKEKDEKNMGL